MKQTPRPYAGEHDLVRMKHLLVEGKRVSPFSGYIHPGDLDWWVYYDPSGEPLAKRVWLWENGNYLLGWTYADPSYADFDLFVHPTLRGQIESAMVDWMEAYLPLVFEKKNGRPLEAVATYADTDDISLIALLQQRGYTDSPHVVQFSQQLVQPPTLLLPRGFHFLERMDATYAGQRAAVHASAFTRRNPDGSVVFKSKMTPNYYREFMLAPDYDPELDVVVVAPDGSFAAFVMAWADSSLRMGEFEPVGTHEDYRRRGLGKATLLEALRRLWSRGMKTVTVMTGAEEVGNIAFYESAGFKICNHIPRFSKSITR